MLGVYCDLILQWYLNHNGSHGLPSTCNQKGYKIPFRRSGHISLHNVLYYILIYTSEVFYQNIIQGDCLNVSDGFYAWLFTTLPIRGLFLWSIAISIARKLRFIIYGEVVATGYVNLASMARQVWQFIISIYFKTIQYAIYQYIVTSPIMTLHDVIHYTHTCYSLCIMTLHNIRQNDIILDDTHKTFTVQVGR